ncbi:hypothetical protein NA57DRAFT_55617 [Rhizodiscina lignyota]|uniref:Uncharacterized protein n=1 Tax=Rhizodiscina lignyota TaxID=1504668 RepID=A0A9P4M9S8_9PEZI|nr:hypothetical protein NA57DRAFT_55617 [Rhizodiscina lignyota]
MENSTTFETTETVASDPTGVSEVAAPSSTAVRQSEGTCDDPSEPDSITKEPLAPEDKLNTVQSNPELYHRATGSSRSLYLEPPPVVRRPPKIKSESVTIAALSWFAWNKTEQVELLYCARSTHRSYYHQTNFRFLGFNLMKDVTFKTSESGIDTALQRVRLGWLDSEINWVRDRLPKAREKLRKYAGRPPADEAGTEDQGAEGQERKSSADIERQNAPARHVPNIAHAWLHDHYYVVVGFMGDESVPKETLRRVMQKDGLFKQIRNAYRHLRNPLRRALSLKEVSGFGIYECDSHKGYHREIELDGETERALTELWRNYSGHKLDYEGRWLMWIHENFNNSSKSPEKGRLTLEFKLRWSVSKVVFWGIVPILLSLAIGFWYMYSDHGDVDDVAVAEAAWVIATYIITSSARK